MIFKNNLFVLIALLSIMALSACQPAPVAPAADSDTMAEADADSDSEGQAADTDEEMMPEGCKIAAPEEAVEINMMGWSFPITDFYADELEKCNEVENLTVNTQLLAGTDAQEQVRLALSAGGDSPFDIVHGANGQVADWGGPGWLMPLNDLIDKYRDEYNLDDIPEKAWEGATLDGQIYGVPIVGNTLHLIYRQDIFDEMGLAVPETYAEVVEVCNAIGLDNADYDMPFTINLSAGWAWEIEFFQMLRAYGGDFLDENNQPTFNGEEGVNAVNLLVEVADACMGVDGYSFSLNDQEVAVQIPSHPKNWLTLQFSGDHNQRICLPLNHGHGHDGGTRGL